MRGRRPGKTGGVSAAIHRGFFRAEHDPDGHRSFVAVERSMVDRLIGSEIYTEGWWLVVGFLQRQGTCRGGSAYIMVSPRVSPAVELDRNCIYRICSG
jgi:hypothetical protein